MTPRLLQLFLLLLATGARAAEPTATGPASPPAAAAPSGAAPTNLIDFRGKDDCTEFREALPHSLTQGFIEVPEDWADKRSPRLRVFYFGRWSKERAPLLIVNGGPGYSSHKYVKLMLADLVGRKIPFIFFDQRGTGCSTGYPADVSGGAPRYAHYGSKEIARDAEALRAKLLGSSPWDVFGHSFGAKVALRYLADSPKGVARIFIQGDSLERNPGDLCDLKNRVVASRATFDLLLEEEPTAADLLRQLERIIPQDLCYGDQAGLVRVCGFDLLRPLGHGMSPDALGKYPMLLGTLLDEKGQLRRDSLDRLVDLVLSLYLDGGRNLVTAVDYPEFVDGRSLCRRAQEEVGPGDPPFPSWGLQTCGYFAALESMPARVKVAHPLLRWPEVGAGLKSNPRATVVEWIGGKDHLQGPVAERWPCAPSPEEAAVTASPRWKRLVLPELSHGNIFDDESFWKALAAP